MQKLKENFKNFHCYYLGTSRPVQGLIRNKFINGIFLHVPECFRLFLQQTGLTGSNCPLFVSILTAIMFHHKFMKDTGSFFPLAVLPLMFSASVSLKVSLVGTGDESKHGTRKKQMWKGYSCDCFHLKWGTASSWWQPNLLVVRGGWRRSYPSACRVEWSVLRSSCSSLQWDNKQGKVHQVDQVDRVDQVDLLDQEDLWIHSRNKPEI